MKEPRQKIAEILGETGCYALVLVDIAEEVLGERIDMVPAYLAAVSNKSLAPNCLVLNGERFLEMLTGVPWKKRYEGADYVAKPGEYEAVKWKRRDGAKVVEHFTRPGYDPYGDSKTVREGWIDSKRIYTRV